MLSFQKWSMGFVLGGKEKVLTSSEVEGVRKACGSSDRLLRLRVVTGTL